MNGRAKTRRIAKDVAVSQSFEPPKVSLLKTIGISRISTEWQSRPRGSEPCTSLLLPFNSSAPWVSFERPRSGVITPRLGVARARRPWRAPYGPARAVTLLAMDLFETVDVEQLLGLGPFHVRDIHLGRCQMVPRSF